MDQGGDAARALLKPFCFSLNLQIFEITVLAAKYTQRF